MNIRASGYFYSFSTTITGIQRKVTMSQGKINKSQEKKKENRDSPIDDPDIGLQNMNFKMTLINMFNK